MKKISSLLLGLSFGLLISCSENNNTINNGNPTTEIIPAEQSENTPSSSSSEPSTTPKQKTDAELMLEGGKLLLSTINDVTKRQRIKDSINAANRENMYAYQIGIKQREKDVYETYNKLIDAGISNVYVFKASRKEYYIVKFEAKGEEDLTLGSGEFKTQLGDNGTEGIKVVNLMEFCSKKETIIKQTETEKGKEIKCLVCD